MKDKQLMKQERYKTQGSVNGERPKEVQHGTFCVYNQLIPLLSIHVQTKKVKQRSTIKYSTVVNLWAGLIQCGPDNNLTMYHPRGHDLLRRYFFYKQRRSSWACYQTQAAGKKTWLRGQAHRHRCEWKLVERKRVHSWTAGTAAVASRTVRQPTHHMQSVTTWLKVTSECSGSNNRWINIRCRESGSERHKQRRRRKADILSSLFTRPPSTNSVCTFSLKH